MCYLFIYLTLIEYMFKLQEYSIKQGEEIINKWPRLKSPIKNFQEPFLFSEGLMITSMP